jgi:hypothetical protein
LGTPSPYILSILDSLEHKVNMSNYVHAWACIL